MALAKVKLSGSTDGKPIIVGSSATTIHTVGASLEEVWLWVANVTGSDATLSILWGGTTDPDHYASKAMTIPANSGLMCVVPGIVLQNSLVVKALSGTASALNIVGYALTGV